MHLQWIWWRGTLVWNLYKWEVWSSSIFLCGIVFFIHFSLSLFFGRETEVVFISDGYGVGSQRLWMLWCAGRLLAWIGSAVGGAQYVL